MRIRLHSLVSNVLSIGVLAALSSTATGCGALSSLANPKVAWALQDPAPMSVVVRRADAAQATVTEVDRLLTATPTSADSDWLRKVGPDPKSAASDMAALKLEPVYQKSHARVVASEVWIRSLPTVRSLSGDHPNLLAAIDQGLGDGYADIMAKKLEIASLTQQIEDEKAARDDKSATPDDKKQHDEAVAKLEKRRSERESEVDPLQKKFLASVRPAAAKLAPAQQEKLLPAIANLIQALDDADIANSAAIVRYPLAIKSLGDSVKDVVPSIASDVVEEKAGTRPDPAKLHAEIALSGTSVSVTLGGVAPADLGGLDVGDVTKEVISRSGKWVLHATTLLATINATKERLSFEHDVLSEIMSGFSPPSAGASSLATKIPAFDSVEVSGATPSVNISLVARAHAGVSETRVSAAAVTPDAKAASPGVKKGDKKVSADTKKRADRKTSQPAK